MAKYSRLVSPLYGMGCVEPSLWYCSSAGNDGSFGDVISLVTSDECSRERKGDESGQK